MYKIRRDFNDLSDWNDECEWKKLDLKKESDLIFKISRLLSLGDLDAIKYCYEKGLDLDQAIFTNYYRKDYLPSATNWHPLQIAMYHGYYDLAVFLMKKNILKIYSLFKWKAREDIPENLLPFFEEKEKQLFINR